MSSRYAAAKTCVFWNVEDCPIPSGLDPVSVARNIKSALAKKGFLGEVTIRAYGDMYQIPDYYQPAGIKLERHGDKSARFMSMNGDFFLWLLENGESTNMMVISGDHSEFAQSLKSCTAANNNILLAQPEDAPRRCSSCRMFVPYEWTWESLSAGGDPIPRAP
ncbi:unnamed protein product [Microthlaspi erraticum]|uniref:NYN domain-containing protein n=1 Tax=Microthlaspi erraticum TaxID=1685480 RepID=A0A6D2IM91_9BRAS|nr:unnamed protein product [Microthlaspi erraticum]